MHFPSRAAWGVQLTRIAVLALALLLAAPEAIAQGSGIISGVVRDSMGLEVQAAEVSVAGTSQRTHTNDRGAFRLVRVSPGDVTLNVRRLGFRAATHDVTVRAGAEVKVAVTLTPIPTQLPVVAVQARREVFDSRLAGFHARRERGGGSFISRDRLDQVHSYRFTDVLRELPGIRIRPLRGGGTTVQMRGADCSPLVFIDGFPAASGPLDLDMIDLFTVEGIEVYHGLASVPAEFSSVRGLERCGVVAIWTRPHRPRPRRDPVPVDLEQLVADRVVFTAEDVDTPAVLTEDSGIPLYPDSLWRSGAGGRVLVEMVVDVTGRVQINSVRIVSATHPMFANAVREALLEAQFEPAVWQGRQVRQLVHLPFVFEVPGSSADSTGRLEH